MKRSTIFNGKNHRKLPFSIAMLQITRGIQRVHYTISGWWLTYPSEKYESIGMIVTFIYGKVKVMFQTTNQLLGTCAGLYGFGIGKLDKHIG